MLSRLTHTKHILFATCYGCIGHTFCCLPSLTFYANRIESGNSDEMEWKLCSLYCISHFGLPFLRNRSFVCVVDNGTSVALLDFHNNDVVSLVIISKLLYV